MDRCPEFTKDKLNMVLHNEAFYMADKHPNRGRTWVLLLIYIEMKVTQQLKLVTQMFLTEGVHLIVNWKSEAMIQLASEPE